MARWWVLPLWIFRVIVDIFTDFLYKLIFGAEDQKKLAPIKSGLLLQPAHVLARMIQQKQVTSVEVVGDFIVRIQDVNPIVNCAVDQRFKEALQEAQAADELIRDCDDLDELFEKKPFLGVPFTTKDCFAVEGLSYTAGLLKRGKRNVKADFNADAVQLMKDAGAIPIAVTNVSELCMWMESSNKVYGRSNNPYHVGRIVGGSSGGEAGLIASAGSVFGIGSDVGGSIRMPAFFCGIFGHKPSTGLVSNAGQIPKAVGVIDTFLTTGPLCRYASDLMPMFKVLLKDHVKSSDCLRLNEKVDLSKIKLYYMEEDGGDLMFSSPVHEDLKKVQLKFVNTLSQAHQMPTPQKVTVKNLKHSFNIWSHKMSSEPSAPSFCEALNEYDQEINPFLELAKWTLFKSSNHTLPGIGLGISEKFLKAQSSSSSIFLKKCEDLKQELENLLGSDGILVYPSHTTPAQYHGQPLLKMLTGAMNFAYTGIFNVTGNPVTQVPLGLGSWGVPLGVQLVCGRNQDRLGLAVALEVEKLFGGWVNPSNVILPD